MLRLSAVRGFGDRPTRPMHYQDYFDEHKEVVNTSYDPSGGYEPYWKDGDWVFLHKNLEEGGSTPTTPHYVCGEVCQYRYSTIKEVCARQISNLNYQGCWLIPFCWGTWLDNLRPGFHTFSTYCEFLDSQCKSDFENKWIFIHEGPCSEQHEYLKPISAAGELHSRATYYYTRLAEERSRLGLKPIPIS